MDSFKLEGIAAVAVVAVLVGSLGINVWSLTRKPEIVAVPVQGSSAMSATLANGEKNPLAHIPQGPRDAVGMPGPQ